MVGAMFNKLGDGIIYSINRFIRLKRIKANELLGYLRFLVELPVVFDVNIRLVNLYYLKMMMGLRIME